MCREFWLLSMGESGFVLCDSLALSLLSIFAFAYDDIDRNTQEHIAEWLILYLVIKPGGRVRKGTSQLIVFRSGVFRNKLHYTHEYIDSVLTLLQIFAVPNFSNSLHVLKG